MVYPTRFPAFVLFGTDQAAQCWEASSVIAAVACMEAACLHILAVSHTAIWPSAAGKTAVCMAAAAYHSRLTCRLKSPAAARGRTPACSHPQACRHSMSSTRKIVETAPTSWLQASVELLSVTWREHAAAQEAACCCCPAPAPCCDGRVAYAAQQAASALLHPMHTTGVLQQTSLQAAAVTTPARAMPIT